MSEDFIINKETIRRLVSDIADIKKNPLNDEGIYYEHDDTDMLRGYALIIGPADTVYFGGFYFFEFKFPYNYPHAPPKVKFHTNDGHTRFHPNLYKTGKCCLSILNTWRGEQWTGCQTLRSVLVTLLSILDKTPLLNEPGISRHHADYNTYDKIIRYKNIKIAILEMMNTKSRCYPNKNNFNIFKKIMENEFEKNKKLIKKLIRKQIKSSEEETNLTTTLYSMNVFINYKALLKDFISLTELKN